MPIEDLDLILKKDPIITTWKAQSLVDAPEDVERNYLIHARTHLSLGDTSKFVDTIFKWVGGTNLGAFIGAVLGDYGEGKTSFLVHVWEQSSAQNILTIPPFEWSSFDQILSAISGWAQYKLQSLHPSLARKVKNSYEIYQKKSIEDIAKKEAIRSGKDYEEILNLYVGAIENGTFRLVSVDAKKILDFVKDISEIVSLVGYKGVLVLLDEPEVAAKELGIDVVQLFIFDLANELNLRQGNYGVFLSMPDSFYATASARFAALTARLQYRGCFPRLGDIYNFNFATILWKRYADEYKLGDLSKKIVPDLTLSAIGQACSSERKDLSYGPRSVVSTFRRMVDRYKATNQEYQPQDFVDDVINNEIMVRPEYRTKIQAVLNSPDVNDTNIEAIMFFAAFPSGVKNEILEEIKYDEIVRPLARSGGLIYKSAFAMGLRELRKTSSATTDSNQLRDIIEDIEGEFAFGLTTFKVAMKSFVTEILPLYFKDRSGSQLDGWQYLNPMKEVSSDIWFGTIIGAFPQMSKVYPQRAAMVVVSSMDSPINTVPVPKLDILSGPQKYDFIFHFSLYWNESQPNDNAPVSISKSGKYIRITFNINIFEKKINQDHLAEIVGSERMTIFWVLYLMQRMVSVNLNNEFEVEWTTLKEMLRNKIFGELNNDEFNYGFVRIVHELMGESMSGSGPDLLDKACALFLRNIYPDYITLVKRPQWQTKIDTYINTLNNGSIPLACKRGRQDWKANDDQAATVFNTSKMNLSGAFNGFEDLIEISSFGRNVGMDIKFKIHPLEQFIRDLILGSTIIIKRDHVQCKYLPLSEILPEILEKGYTIEELNKVISIGKARNSFEEANQGAERGFFTRPLDIEELKLQLRTKLGELNSELREFKKIPDSKNPFDPIRLEDQVEQIQDEVDFDTVRTSLDNGFHAIHLSIQTHYNLLNDSLIQLKGGVDNYANSLLNSREVTQLKLPDAKSIWRDSLQRCIMVSLSKQIEDFKNDCNCFGIEVNKSSSSYSNNQNKSDLENLETLNVGWGKLSEFESQKNKIGLEANKILKHLSDFNQWVLLLSKSDQVYESIIALGTNENHKIKYQEFLSKFDDIGKSITDHLETLNVNGLTAHRQYFGQIGDLEKEANQYLINLKATFDQYKDRLNRTLDRLGVSDRAKLSFNPLETNNQYTALRMEGVDLFRGFIIEQIGKEIEVYTRELVYARDILSVIMDDEALPYINRFKNNSKELDELGSMIDDLWLDKLVSEKDDGYVQELDMKIKSMFSDIQAVRQKVRELTQPTKTISKEGIVDLFEKIPERGQVDLKDLILLTMAKVNDPSQALSNSLESLTDLFKQNLIQIKVEKRQR